MAIRRVQSDVCRGFRNPAPTLSRPIGADSGGRASPACRITKKIRHFGVRGPLSGFQEPARSARGAQHPRGFRNRQAAGRRQTPARSSRWLVSGYWEPTLSGDQELRITGYSGPQFVVTGTDSRGFRNHSAEFLAIFQDLSKLSTALNALTSFSNRISFNAAAAETSGKTPPLGGFAPAGSLRRFAATPRALTRPPTRHPPSGVGLRPTSYSWNQGFL